MDELNDCYVDNVKNYQKTLEISKRISNKIGGRFVDERKGWASILFTKLCTTGNSLFLLAPHNSLTNQEDHWDYSSMFSLTRNLMECYQTFFYLCIENISKNEYILRKKLFDYHDLTSRKKLFSLMHDHKQTEEDERIEEFVIKELKENELFKTLPEKQQSAYLKGDKAFFITREDIEERFGNDRNAFKMYYKLLSSNTHSYPMGFYRIQGAGRGTGLKTPVEEGYSSLALKIANDYLMKALKNILSLFPDSIVWLTNDEKTYLKIEHTDDNFLKTKKLGRNDNCYCGSGKKYKNCCL